MNEKKTGGYDPESGAADYSTVNERKLDRIALFVTAVLSLMVFAYIVTPEMGGITDDVRKAKAGQDCDTIVMAIEKYNSTQGGAVVKSAEMSELQGKFITNMDTIRDPWGEKYRHDAAARRVFSKGPDRRHDDADLNAAVNADDVRRNYVIVSGPVEAGRK